MIILLLLSSASALKRHSGPDAATIDAEEEASRKQQDWEDHMKAFVPSDLITFELPGKSKTEFYEEIEVIPSTIKGAWFSSDEKSKDLDLQIFDVKGEVVFERRRSNEGIFTFEAKRQGQYRFVFISHNYNRKQAVTFALHLGNSTDEVLQNEHLSPIENILLVATKSIKDFQMNQQIAHVRRDSHFRSNV